MTDTFTLFNIKRTGEGIDAPTETKIKRPRGGKREREKAAKKAAKGGGAQGGAGSISGSQHKPSDPGSVGVVEQSKKKKPRGGKRERERAERKAAKVNGGLLAKKNTGGKSLVSSLSRFAASVRKPGGDAPNGKKKRPRGGKKEREKQAAKEAAKESAKKTGMKRPRGGKREREKRAAKEAAQQTGPSCKRTADGVLKRTSAAEVTVPYKLQLNNAVLKIVPRSLKKGDIAYTTEDVEGGKLAQVHIPCLPMFGDAPVFGDVSPTEKLAIDSAACMALDAINADPELKEILDKGRPAKIGEDGLPLPKRPRGGARPGARHGKLDGALHVLSLPMSNI
eukprot:gnl/MRDRNA2_/MRDRNA2_76392_c0_seq2.p1 gnl/MRDRNA2_/MRDRNA2_76392_c0~~gnl/MRDRNA2_/MRDRNA2_76392_c0_seq2.p1  ORF type:complete len:337 (+),score=85.65 gnl/MRDRNA2_/MRDRNA2_76392_c0_seq2:102-1112(+)